MPAALLLHHKKCILPIAAGRRPIGTDDGFRSNLCVLFCLCFCCKIAVIFQVFIHVLVDQSTIMRTLNISADSYVYPNQNINDPCYQKIMQLLGQCSQYQLSVLLATAEALVWDNPTKKNDT